MYLRHQSQFLRYELELGLRAVWGKGVMVSVNIYVCVHICLAISTALYVSLLRFLLSICQFGQLASALSAEKIKQYGIG